jgi:hypothetical protein
MEHVGGIVLGHLPPYTIGRPIIAIGAS